MRIALLIGVSDYDTLATLPACRSDVDVMTFLIRTTGRYDYVLPLSGCCKAADTKNKALSFLEEVGQGEVDEVLFYFSGHGELGDDDLYYVMSDYDRSRLRQTSLENQEVDQWLRKLSPRLTVKIIDCCYAGVSYVKGNMAAKALLETSRDRFQNCYFMFSSQSDQESLAGTHLSEFTKEILSGIRQCPNGNVRYKDIIDVVSDTFDGRDGQIPQFVVQATMSDVFCIMDDNLRKQLEGILQPLSADKPEAPVEEALSLQQLVERDAANCFAKEYVSKLLQDLRAVITAYELPES